MKIIIIIAAIAAAIYIYYAALACYYVFKNWRPLCGCKGTVGSPETRSQAGTLQRT